jgi:peptidoglycan-N-acetylglucosamine deacetylase
MTTGAAHFSMMPQDSAQPTKPFPHILTVDVEDWFHICGVGDRLPRAGWDRLESRVVPNTLGLLDLLDRFGARATFFVLGWVAQRQPDLVREIARRGHEIASHGTLHQRVYTLSPRAFEADLLRSLELLTPLATHPVRGYRAPEWSIRDDSLWALDILGRNGLVYDASMAPLPVIGNPVYPCHIHRRAFAGGALWEVPPLVAQTPWINLPAGGGWGLRVLPQAWIAACVRRRQRRGQPAVFFVHPREMDRDNPKIRLPWLKQCVVSARLRATQTSLLWLLKRWSFTSISTYLLKYVKEKG